MEVFSQIWFSLVREGNLGTESDELQLTADGFVGTCAGFLDRESLGGGWLRY